MTAYLRTILTNLWVLTGVRTNTVFPCLPTRCMHTDGGWDLTRRLHTSTLWGRRDAPVAGACGMTGGAGGCASGGRAQGWARGDRGGGWARADMGGGWGRAGKAEGCAPLGGGSRGGSAPASPRAPPEGGGEGALQLADSQTCPDIGRQMHEMRCERPSLLLHMVAVAVALPQHVPDATAWGHEAGPSDALECSWVAQGRSSYAGLAPHSSKHRQTVMHSLVPSLMQCRPCDPPGQQWSAGVASDWPSLQQGLYHSGLGGGSRPEGALGSLLCFVELYKRILSASRPDNQLVSTCNNVQLVQLIRRSRYPGQQLKHCTCAPACLSGAACMNSTKGRAAILLSPGQIMQCMQADSVLADPWLGYMGVLALPRCSRSWALTHLAESMQHLRRELWRRRRVVLMDELQTCARQQDLVWEQQWHASTATAPARQQQTWGSWAMCTTTFRHGLHMHVAITPLMNYWPDTGQLQQSASDLQVGKPECTDLCSWGRCLRETAWLPWLPCAEGRMHVPAAAGEAEGSQRRCAAPVAGAACAQPRAEQHRISRSPHRSVCLQTHPKASTGLHAEWQWLQDQPAVALCWCCSGVYPWPSMIPISALSRLKHSVEAHRASSPVVLEVWRSRGGPWHLEITH